MPFFRWSKVSASNGSADPTINFSEGQPPGSINDSARAEMAALKKWGDDISGTITTGGTSTAYTVSSNSVFDTLANMSGAMLAFIPHATNGGACTLNVDSLGAKPLRPSPGVDLPAGTIILGTPYVATFNNADGAWYLQGFTINPYNIPIGGYLDFSGDTPPNSSFILPAGQAISRTTYATYFGMSGIGTRYGVGDGSTTFNVPDLRGRVAAGLDNLNGSAANRITVAGGNFDGTVLGGTGGGQNQTLTQAQLPAVGLSIPAMNLQVPAGWATANPAQFGHTGVAAPGGGGTVDAMTPGGGAASWETPASTTGNMGSGNSHPILPPVIMVTKLLRII